MADLIPWTRHSFDGVAQSGRYGVAEGAADVHATLLAPAIAQVAAYRGTAHECRSRLAGYLGVGVEALAPRRASFGRDRDAFWIGPDRWLIVGPNPEDLEAILGEALGASAAITGQSDGRFALRLAGSRVRACLAKGVSVDLHPRVFLEGDCAPVLLSHLNCVIARRRGPDVFDLVGPRAAAGDIWHWLLASAGEYGLVLETPT